MPLAMSSGIRNGCYRLFKKRIEPIVDVYHNTSKNVTASVN